MCRILGVVLSLLFAYDVMAQKNPTVINKARKIHNSIITLDTHIDIPYDFATSSYDTITKIKPAHQFDIPSMILGNLDSIFLVVFVSQGPRTQTGYAKALSDGLIKFRAIHRLTTAIQKKNIVLALSAEQVRNAHKDGKKSALIGIENGYIIGTDLSLINKFYKLGARYFGFLHFGHNDLGDSSVPNIQLGDAQEEHFGLSQLGKEVLRTLNNHGIIPDISHSSKKTALDIVNLSRSPVIASHSNVQGIYNHPRNLSDEELFAIKKNNGVVQVVAYDAYLKNIPEEKKMAIAIMQKSLGIGNYQDLYDLGQDTLKEYQLGMANINQNFPSADLSVLLDHIDYIVEKIGVDHVGISSDFNGGGGIKGWENVADTFNVTLELLERGYSENEIEKIWGENTLRVMEEVNRISLMHKRQKR